jgi:hypothetical protein
VLTRDGRFLVMDVGCPPCTAEHCQKALLERVL